MPRFNDYPAGSPPLEDGARERMVQDSFASYNKLLARRDNAVTGTEEQCRVIFDEYRRSCPDAAKCKFRANVLKGAHPCKNCKRLVKADYFCDEDELRAEIEIRADHKDVATGVKTEGQAVRTMADARARVQAAK